MWPYWLCSSRSPVSPFILKNSCDTDRVSFSNFLTREKFYSDNSGMIYPSFDTWAVETWIVNDKVLFRPQQYQKISDHFKLRRDPYTSMISTHWVERDFEITSEIFGAKTTIDEIVIDISAILKKQFKQSQMLIAVRPYNQTTLGGIEKIEFIQGENKVRINGKDSIIFITEPNSFYTGNGEIGDIDINRKVEGKISSICKSGMSTLAAGFKLKKGENTIKLRIGLSDNNPIKSFKLNTGSLKKDYAEYARMRIQNGFKLQFPDKDLTNWFYSTKMTCLNCANDVTYNSPLGKPSTETMKNTYYTVHGFNRMGYFRESLNIITKMIGSIPAKDVLALDESICVCYAIISLVDYFSLSRDLEYIQSHYESVRNKVHLLLPLSKKYFNRKRLAGDYNSLKYSVLKRSSIFDTILYAYTFKAFAYLSRCIGLFGEEIKFNKESNRLENIILSIVSAEKKGARPVDNEENEIDKDKDDSGTNLELNGPESGQSENQKDEFFAYSVFSGYPFKLDAVSNDDLLAIINGVLKDNDPLPVFVPSLGGYDVVLSLVSAINMLQLKDSRCYAMVQYLLDSAGDRYSLAEIVNPDNSHGISLEGDSVVASSQVFSFIRNCIFIDYPHRLELFPVPRIEWFYPGQEIEIKEAPSRFGLLSIKITMTQNDIHFHFNEMPQFIPPDIMINLPFRATINEEDDFVIKKSIGNSFIINGWPSIIRFTRQ